MDASYTDRMRRDKEWIQDCAMSRWLSRLRTRTLPNPLDRPSRVFRDKRFRITAGSVERGQICRVARIAQGDADISQESAALDPFDR